MKKKILFTLLTILLSPSLWAQEVFHWQFDAHAYQHDMTANVVLQVSGATLTDYANYEVAAFCNDECRGIADFQKVGDTETQVGYLRIYSKDITGDKITFKAYDKLRQKEMIIPDTELTFAEDETHGLPSNPLKLVAYYLFDVTTAANGQGTVTEGGVVLGGNSITLTATPDEGYHFVSWTDGGTVVSTEASFTYKPENDVTLTANFQISQFRVRFVADGVDVFNKMQDFGSVITKPENPAKEGHTFTGWSPEVDANVPAHDVTYNAQFSINQYTMTFVLGNGEENVVKTQDYGTSLTAPEGLTKTGYTFGGWDSEVPTTTPGANKIFTAIWTPTSYPITYVLNGGAVSEANPTTYTIETEDFTLKNPTREGFQFSGWESADLVGSNLTVTIAKGSTGNRTYTAIWSTESYTISYDLDGGKLAAGVANPTTYSYESDAITLNNPTREGYTFLGWTSTGLTEATKDVTIPQHSTGNRSYKATWQINKHTVTFYDRREGFEDKVIKTDELEFGTAIEFPTENPEWEGHDFIAWKADKAPGEGGTVPDYDVTYYSAWNILELSLSYKIDGEAYGEATQVAYGADIEKKPDPAPREGYTFSGWKGFPETGKMPAYDLVIRGEYIPIEYSITYNLADGKLDAGVENPTTYTIKSADITLKNPSREGYTFAGWTGTGLDEAAATVTIAKGSTGDRTYTATWTAEEYTMTFVLGNGEENVVRTRAYQSELTAPENLQRTGYTFNGWIPEVPATVPVGDQTFTAQWTINSYQLQFMVDGQAISEASVVYEGTFDTPKDPEKPGYTFKGWDAEIPEKMPAANLTFNAVFEAIVYTITYDP